MEDRREMGCEVLSLSEQESQSSHSEDVGV